MLVLIGLEGKEMTGVEMSFPEGGSNVKALVVTVHDACPALAPGVFRLANELENMGIPYNIALIPFFNERQDLPRFPDVVERIKSLKAEVVLHGLYHQDKSGKFDDFHTITKRVAEEEARAALEIFMEIGITPKVFIPPAWKLNRVSIEVLAKLGFVLAEEQEKYILISKRDWRRVKVSKVLNWDSTGHPAENIGNIDRCKRQFMRLVKNQPSFVRVALHPNDPHRALHDQEQMISQFIGMGYRPTKYSGIVAMLQNLQRSH